MAGWGLSCDLAGRCDGWFCTEPVAHVELAETGSGWTIELDGTHADPDRIDRLTPRKRLLDAEPVAVWGEKAFRFADRETVGLLTIDYAMKAGLSLHVAGVDRAYTEQYTGLCEARQ